MSKTKTNPIILVKPSTGNTFTLNSDEAAKWLRQWAAGEVGVACNIQPLNHAGRKAIEFAHLPVSKGIINRRAIKAGRRSVKRDMKAITRDVNYFTGEHIDNLV